MIIIIIVVSEFRRNANSSSANAGPLMGRPEEAPKLIYDGYCVGYIDRHSGIHGNRFYRNEFRDSGRWCWSTINGEYKYRNYRNYRNYLRTIRGLGLGLVFSVRF